MNLVRAFFPKSGHFSLNFEKGQGRPPLLPPLVTRLPSYLKYWDVNNLYGWAMSHKTPISGFKWIENMSQFSKDFPENYNEDSDVGYFFCY